jgi:exopolysaccharide production protein ExoQ
MNTKSHIDAGRLPWGTFSLLTAAFWFASRADLFYTVKEQPMATILAGGGRSDDPIKLAALLVLSAWSVLTIWRGRSFLTEVNWLQTGLLVLYSVWCALSLLWTDDAKLTVNKVAILGITFLVATAVAYRFTFREITILTFLSSFISNALGFGAEIALGTFHPLDPLYRFSGLWHPNTHGLSLSILVLAGLVLLKTEHKHRLAISLMTLFGLVLLLLSRSRTAFGSTIIAALCAWLLALPPVKRWAVLATGTAVVCLGMFISANDIGKLPLDMFLLGRKDTEASTLTNRIPLWKDCLPYIGQQPWLGYGYGGFWTLDRILLITAPEEAAWSTEFEKHVNDNNYLPDAHNLYIETLLNTGIIGAIFLIGDLFLAIGAFGVKTCRSGAAAYSFGFSVLLWMALESCLEAVAPQPFLPLLICPVLLLKAACVSEVSVRREASAIDMNTPELTGIPEVQHA